MEEYGIIYTITNKTNGKCYIGLTTQGLMQRRAEHRARHRSGSRNHKLYLAFNKYGFDNFDWEIIDTAVSKDSLDKKEIYYISAYRSYNNGYNATEGGCSLSKEIIEKIRKKLTGRNITWGYKTRATRIARNNYGQDQPKGVKSKLAKEYVVTEPNGTEHYVKGLNAWCKSWGKEKLFMSSLSSCAMGTYKQYKGYKCRYFTEPPTTSPKGRTPQAMAVEAGDTLQG